MGSVIVWFRRDFRFQDNKALSEALSYCKKHHFELIFTFHLNRKFLNESNSLRHQFFMATMLDFAKRCRKLGTELQVVEGEPEKAFQHLLSKHNDAKAVYFNQDEAGYGKERDERITSWLDEKGIHVYSFQDAYIHGPNEIRKKDGTVYKVFSPYYKAWKKLDKPVSEKLSFDELGKFTRKAEPFSKNAMKDAEKLSKGFDEQDWEIGEKAARERMKKFIDQSLEEYPEGRDIPGIDGTSLMSRYLKTGCISPRTVFSAIQQADAPEDSKEAYIRELAFRDFYQMIFANYPETKDQEFIEAYRSLDWNKDEQKFQAWKDGQTGYPIVDAGMRQLNREGWMHNRLRMITASFLTKDLLIDWRLGENYFASKLVDYDPGSNIGGWQWAASVGTDAVPYFRVFNPVTQSKRFDSKGDYIRKYINELADIPSKYIHEPWKMPDKDQREAACLIGKDYPEPIVDHQKQRKLAIEMFKDEK
ncbi:cryptochrome/photolyase family protein [Metabacillus sp. 84]|uniref:cryptochrome/photolyase family protein n=1 Tax=Metabacillus sp. 84 TaxID=3404705 RepID=UPI003CFB2868